MKTSYLTLLALASSMLSASAVTLIGPVELARWDASDGTLDSTAAPLPFLDVAPVSIIGGGGVASGAGSDGGDAFVLNGSDLQLPTSFVTFSVTNTHPSETFEIDEFSIGFRAPNGFSPTAGLFFDISTEPSSNPFAFGDFDDAIQIPNTWGGFILGNRETAFLDVRPGETLTFLLGSNDDGPSLFVDDVVITGTAIVPEPAATSLLGFGLVLALRRRR